MIETALGTTAVKAGLYAGTVGTSKLYRLPSFGEPDKLAFSPQGTVIAQGYESGLGLRTRSRRHVPYIGRMRLLPLDNS